MSTSGGGGKVYLRGDGERMRAACPVLMVRPWWCGGYVGGVAGGAGMVSTSGACAVVCLRGMSAAGPLAVMMSGGVAGLTCAGIGSSAGGGGACVGAVALLTSGALACLRGRACGAHGAPGADDRG